MCRYLDGVGEMYFIQVLENGEYISVGDVTVKPENPPIAIWVEKYRGVGIGAKVMKTVIGRLSSLGYKKITGSTVYKWNVASQKMHERLGFTRVGENDKDYIYEGSLKMPQENAKAELFERTPIPKAVLRRLIKKAEATV
ncbi:MAG: GNAT family N-acetyltransferase [Ruminococcus sp.]|nr:GNAT family N-acetyltransferase [Ruminococcus sp.]